MLERCFRLFQPTFIPLYVSYKSPNNFALFGCLFSTFVLLLLTPYICIYIYGKGQQASTDGLKSIMSSLVWAKLLFWLWNAKTSVGDRNTNRKHGSLCPLPHDNNITLTKPYAKEMLSVMDYQTGQHFKLFQIDFHASLAWYGISGSHGGKSLWKIGSKIVTAVYSFNTLSRTASLY